MYAVIYCIDTIYIYMFLRHKVLLVAFFSEKQP